MNKSIETFIKNIPKVELHVHLEGAIQPETLLQLAQRNQIDLPATDLDSLRAWYAFKDFPHFAQVYLKLSECIKTPDDIELIAREFLAGQAAQQIRYSEVTYTAFTHYHFKGIPFADQLAALNRARVWAEAELGTTMGIVLDIPRPIPAEFGLTIAEWAISAMGNGVIALGLGGPEQGFPAEKFREAFDRAYAAGLPSVPHAGETAGPESIREALDVLHAQRIGHGVRCLDDPRLVDELRERQIPLEVCPSSNVCLGVAASIAEHPLPRLLDAGLYVTINSDDPPMFATTLTDEYIRVAQAFGLGREEVVQLVVNAIRASLLPDAEKAELEKNVWYNAGNKSL